MATAPSHAAVDALTLAILRQWNEDILGYPSTKLIRIGNALRLSDSRVESWLPKPTSNSVKYYEELELTRNSMLKLAKMHGKKLFIEEEQELTRKLRLLEAVKYIFGKRGCFRMGQVCKLHRGPFIYYVSTCRGEGQGVRKCQILHILRTKNILA